MRLASFWPGVAERLSEPGRYRADHGRSLHRAAPGLRADGQTAYGRLMQPGC